MCIRDSGQTASLGTRSMEEYISGKGQVEHLAGLQMLIEKAQSALAEGKASILKNLMEERREEKITLALLEEAAKHHDKDIEIIFEETIKMWAMLAINVDLMINPEIIVLGGSISKENQYLSLIHILTTMAGQNMGAGDIPRVKKDVRAGLLISVLVSLVMIAMFQLFAQQVIMLFNTDAEVVREGVLYLRICCSLNCAAYAVMYTCNSFATGIGAAGFALVNSMIDCVVTRIVLSYLVGVTFGCGFLGIYVVEMAAPVLPAIAGFLYFKSRRWEKRSLIHAGQGGGNRARDNG